MDIDAQAVINDLLEQNKQLTLQLAVARSMITRLQEESQSRYGHDHSRPSDATEQ